MSRTVGRPISRRRKATSAWRMKRVLPISGSLATGSCPGENHEAAYDRVARGLCLLGDLAGSQGVKVLLETHGEFASGRHARAIMQRANHPAVGVLWDVHHPYKYAGEALSYTLDAIRPWLFHVHLKDSKGPWATHRLTVPGRGHLPLKEAVHRLWLSGYDGWAISGA